MGCVWATVPAGAGEWDSLLVACKLDELAELFLSEHLQGGPKKLNVLVGLHQTHLIHGVSLMMKESKRQTLTTNQSLFDSSLTCSATRSFFLNVFVK